MKNATFYLLILVVSISLCAGLAHAHRVFIYAYAQDGRIYTESGFGKDRPVVKGTVEIRNAKTGELLLSCEPDVAGKCDFAIPRAAREGRMDLAFTVFAGEGHQGGWRMAADEYLPPVQDAGAGGAESPGHGEPPVDAAATPPASLKELPEDLQDIVRNAVRQELAQQLEQQLGPIRRSLAAMQNPTPGLREIVGGLGWILGLCGVAALAYNRRK